MRRTLAALAAILTLTAFDADPIPLPETPEWVWKAALVEWQSRAVHGLDQTLIGEWRWYRDTYFPPPPRVEPKRRVEAQDTPNPAPTSQPAYNPGVEQWRPLVAIYFPADQVDHALRVMACESGGNPWAYNPSGASGLMQVLASWADNFGYQPADLFDPDINLYVASLLYYDGGWAHWVCKG